MMCREAVVEMGRGKAASGGKTLRAGQAVLFTRNPEIVAKEKDKVTYCGLTEQDVLCIDERQVIVRSKGMFQPPNAAAEGIYSDLQRRYSGRCEGMGMDGLCVHCNISLSSIIFR